MPTMTPCVVKSPDGTVVRVAVRSCWPDRSVHRVGSQPWAARYPGVSRQEFRGGLDAIGAATIAVQDVLGTSNGHIRTEGRWKTSSSA
jgi:hypothetical protein